VAEVSLEGGKALRLDVERKGNANIPRHGKNYGSGGAASWHKI